MKAPPSPRTRRPHDPPRESSSAPHSTLVHHPIETPLRVYAPPGEKFCDILKNSGDTLK